MVGRVAETQKAMGRLREIDPTLRLSNLDNFMRFRRAEDNERFVEALRKAGLPE